MRTRRVTRRGAMLTRRSGFETRPIGKIEDILAQRIPASSRVAVGVALAALALAVIWPAGGTVAHAQAEDSARVVEGTVVNGTAGAHLPDELTVVLHKEGAARHDHLETSTDAEGRFRFEGIAFEPDLLYGVTVKHQAALYGTDLDLSQGSPAPVSLTVFEATDADTSLGVSAASILLAQADVVTQMMWALEIVKIVNDTDRTYVPGRGPMSLLRFGLPPGAESLQVDTGLLGADVLQVDRGFALTASVPPGEHEVMYAYRFPYFGNEATLSRSFPYGAANLRVLAPYEIAQLASQELEGPEAVTIGSRPYQLLTGADLPRGSRITLELGGLPRATFSERLGYRLRDLRLEYVAPMGLGLLMVILIGLALWRRSLSPRTASVVVADTQSEHARLVGEIARLDVRFEEGGLSETRHHRERGVLTSRLAALSRMQLTDPG